MFMIGINANIAKDSSVEFFATRYNQKLVIKYIITPTAKEVGMEAKSIFLYSFVIKRLLICYDYIYLGFKFN